MIENSKYLLPQEKGEKFFSETCMRENVIQLLILQVGEQQVTGFRSLIFRIVSTVFKLFALVNFHVFLDFILIAIASAHHVSLYVRVVASVITGHDKLN